MYKQSSDLNFKVCLTGLINASGESDNQNRGTIHKSSGRRVATARWVFRFGAALTLLAVCCVQGRAQTLVPNWNQLSPANSPPIMHA